MPESNRSDSTRRGGGLAGALCLFLFFVIFVAGCAGVKQKAAEDYFKVLDRWSRGDRVFAGLESRLYMNATYKTPEFRRAYTERYAASYELSAERAAALMEREDEQGQAYNEFLFTAFTPDESLNDFDRKDSVWQMYIEDTKGNRGMPISVARVSGSEPVVREFFPYFDLWSKAYTVKFPKYADNGDEIAPDKGVVRLIVTGVMGKGELVWGK